MWKNRTIFQKIFMSTMLLVVLMLFSYYSFIVYYEYKNNTETTVEESINLSEKINEALQDYITQIDGTITSFYYELYQNKEGALASLLSSDDEPTVEEGIWQNESLERYFSQLFLMRGDFVNVYIYRSDEKNYLYSPYSRKKLNYSPKESAWYQETQEKNGKTNITLNYLSEYTKYTKNVIGFSRMLKDVGNQGIIGNTVVMLEFAMKNLDNLIDNYITNDMTTVLLVDEQGNIVYQRGAEIELGEEKKLKLVKQGTGVESQSINGERYILSSDGKRVYEWQVMILTNKDYILMKTKDYFRFTVAIGILLIVASAIICYYFSKNLYRPIAMLKNGMETIQKGEFDIQIKRTSNDELGQLIEDFNCMAHKTKTLIKEKYEEELQKKDAQYKFLQAQIDPHFIFNTLQIISSMAIVNNVLEIETVSNSLARLLRYSISGEQKTILLKEELKNVTSYLEIQKIRFKNRLSYEIHMEPCLKNISIIKLVLQPIIENGISHGFEEKGGSGRIEIHGYMEEERIFIEIMDDGIGMSEVEVDNLMKKINEPLRRRNKEQIKEEEEQKMREQRNHVGLRNINLRIKMYYGEDYGIFIKSQKGKGTTVTVCIRKEQM